MDLLFNDELLRAMKSRSRTSPNWTPLPDPIAEDEVRLELSWTADERTRTAIERQAKLMGFESPTAYLLQPLAAVIVGNEPDTVLSDDGRFVKRCYADDRNGMSQDV